MILLSEAKKVFSKYPIILVVPDDMPKEKYPIGKGIFYEVVPGCMLQSVGTYNQMMVERDFYKRFVEYEYILIYQLDAFVFRDELEQFCDYGYDYIGAPWIKGSKYFIDLEHGVW